MLFDRPPEGPVVDIWGGTMPLRSQAKIRRDIGRLDALVQEHAAVHAPLAAIQPEITAMAARVNALWRSYQSAALTASKEINERKTAIAKLSSWVRSWRGVVLIKLPGALENIRELPPRGATADDLVRLAGDLQTIISTRPEAEPFRAAAATVAMDIDIALFHVESATWEFGSLSYDDNVEGFDHSPTSGAGTYQVWMINDPDATPCGGAEGEEYSWAGLVWDLE